MSSTPRLHGYQQATLRHELSQETYASMSADEAYGRVTSPEVAKRLARTSYEPTAELAAAFPWGVPGFPNKVRRADFDLIWSEVQHG